MARPLLPLAGADQPAQAARSRAAALDMSLPDGATVAGQIGNSASMRHGLPGGLAVRKQFQVFRLICGNWGQCRVGVSMPIGVLTYSSAGPVNPDQQSQRSNEL